MKTPALELRTLACFALLGAPAAFANIGAVRSDPAIGGSLHTGATELAVVSEELTIDCTEAEHRPSCGLRAVYTVHNPTPSAQTATAAFYGVHASEVAIVRDGASIARDLPEEVAAAIDHRVGLEPTEELTRVGLEVTLAQDETAVLVVTGRLSPGERIVPSYAVPAVEIRHALLGTRARSRAFDLRYLVAPIRSWGAHPATVSVTLRHPAAWTATGLDGAATLHDGVRALHAVLDVARVDELAVAFTLPQPVVFNGGVLLGVGATTSGRLRVRAGYELAAPEWLFWSVCAETDFQTDLALIPLVQAASPSLLNVIPSFSLGVGVPVRLLPARRAGVRGQLTAQWPFLGVVLTVDGFPTAPQNAVEVGLLVQVGL